MTPPKSQVDIGAYAYDAATSTFVQKIPKGSADPYSLVKVTVPSKQQQDLLRHGLGISMLRHGGDGDGRPPPPRRRPDPRLLRLHALRQPAGHPRTGARDNGTGTGSGSNNPESVYPKFGHYSSATAGLQFTTDMMLGGDQFTPSNVTEADPTNDNKPADRRRLLPARRLHRPGHPGLHTSGNTSGPTIPADSTLNADKLGRRATTSCG